MYKRFDDTNRDSSCEQLHVMHRTYVDDCTSISAGEKHEVEHALVVSALLFRRMFVAKRNLVVSPKSTVVASCPRLLSASPLNLLAMGSH